jgi:hypothetical protein
MRGFSLPPEGASSEAWMPGNGFARVAYADCIRPVASLSGTILAARWTVVG